MKRINYTLLPPLILFLVSYMTSCTSDDITNCTNEDDHEDVTITASNYPITRMSYTFDKESYYYTVKWKGSSETFREALGLYEPSTNQSFVAKRLPSETEDILGSATFDVNSNSDKKTFNPTLEHYGVYPLTSQTYESKFGNGVPGEISLSTASQSGKLDDLQNTDYMVAKGTNNLLFDHKVAFLIIKNLTISGASSGKVTDLVVSADGLRNEATLNMSDGTLKESSIEQSNLNTIRVTSTFTLENGKIAEPIAITFFPGTLSRFYLSCKVDGKSYSKQFTNTDILMEAGKFYVMDTPEFALSSRDILTPGDAVEGSGIVDGEEATYGVGGTVADYVDLGLVDEEGNHVLWATHNLGASNPEECGAYIAWAERGAQEEGYINGVKIRNGVADYSSDKVKYYNASTDEYTKYIVDWWGEVKDNLNTLEPSDDAATVNWGSPWRIPTANDWFKLLRDDRITREIIYYKGYKFTSKIPGYEGATIFIPFNGYYQGKQHIDSTDHCCYWTSSLTSFQNNYTYFATDADFGLGSCNIYRYYRYIGFCIRPVWTKAK